MKCKACNGKGYFTGCIYESDEVGFVDKDYECAVCHGTGQIEQTNEEYIHSLNTEQLAEWLRGVYWHCHEIDCEHCNYPWRCMEKGDIVEWLKQPHTIKE